MPQIRRFVMASELQPDVDALASRIRASDPDQFLEGGPVCITDARVIELLAAQGFRFVGWFDVNGQDAIEVA